MANQTTLTKAEKIKYIKQVIDTNDKTLQEKIKYVTDLFENDRKGAEANLQLEYDLNNKFRKYVTDKKIKFFSLDDIDRSLGIKYDILILLSKKNIGKTGTCYRIMEECIDRGKKFIFMRISRKELDNVTCFNEDERSPVKFIKKGGIGRFYSKADIAIQKAKFISSGKDLEEEFTFQETPSNLEKIGVEPVGVAYEGKGCQSYTGGGYEDYDTIIIDEVVNFDSKETINEVNHANGGAFLNSVSRRKPAGAVRVYMFGNLLSPRTAILDHYGIQVDEPFRYILRPKTNSNDISVRILYINAENLYPGAEDIGGVSDHSSAQFRASLRLNSYIAPSTKMVKTRVFNLLDPYCAFLFLGHIIIVKRLQDTNQKTIIGAVGAIPITGFESYFEIPIWTDSMAEVAKYSCLRYRNSLRNFHSIIFRLLSIGGLFYGKQETMIVIENLIRVNPYGLVFPRLNLDVKGASKFHLKTPSRC